ncbi:cytochrome-c oxidase, cbb3-type subunit III [Marinihelvus fidelis]|uniref:Cbb3-type cytochrome c oxidase subunit n=1 Tax=Marinihelvus fidelis TaxID=2613842 RepID=A0A5N0TFC3_9GAMM|nr:cytochrome-c oxidase, cbb3-type subunit III [Marinihelvus fidelis]KAA9132576.1 cytochrome-c oxidase, cbb3-type subunit III [Marinihelvus fidelis]
MNQLTSFWSIFVIIVSIGSILACWWLLHWTKGISDRDDDGDIHDTGHVWDHDIRELNHPLPRWWLHLFNITIIFALVYLVLYPGLGNLSGLLGWTQVQRYEEQVEKANAATAEVLARYEGMTPAELVGDPQAMETGRRLFGNYCAMCHGSDGGGGPGFPNLADDYWQWGEGYDSILTAINQGRQAAMPPLGAAMDYPQLFALAQYVRSLSGLDHEAAQAQKGQQDYAMLCVACHGVEGHGMPALGAPSLVDDEWLYGNSVDDIVFSVQHGRNGRMPAHESLMSEPQRRILAAYVLGLSGNSD